MNNKQLTTINQNAKSALIKSKNLLDITKKILDKKELIKSFEFRHFLMEKGHSGAIKSVSISLDGKYIVSGSHDKTIKIWDIKTAECLKTLEGHKYSVNSVAISPNGKYIVSGSSDSTIKIWNIKTGENIYTIDNTYNISIDNNGFFNASDENIDKYLRVSEAPLTQRKLTLEEINHFRKKDDFLDVNERTKIEC